MSSSLKSSFFFFFSLKPFLIYYLVAYWIFWNCFLYFWRTLCDNLRRERDRAVSDLAEALRNLDDMRKQKNDAVRELKELKYVTEIIGIFVIKTWLR